MNAKDAQEAAQRAAEKRYGPEVSEVNLPPTDPVREAKRRDIDDPADVEVNPDDLRNGGPTRTPGAVTTTGGKAGPANVHRVRRHGDKVAPTTTGDATTGGMGNAAGGSTSDAMSGAESAGNYTRKR